ncbi:MAG: hypothetical protein RL642_674 [Bacteroidota bacterium]
MKSRIVVFVIVAFSCFNACKNGDSKTKYLERLSTLDTGYASLIPGSFIDSSSLTIDSTLIPLFFIQYPALKIFEKEVYSFYQKRSFDLAWHDSSGRIEAFQLLFNRSIQMEADGLAEEVPYLEDFKRFANKSTNDSTAFVDLMQTAQYFHFANHVLGGLSEEKLVRLEWHIPKPKRSYVDLLQELISGNQEVLNKSMYPQYFLLKHSLLQLKKIQDEGGWPSIAPVTSSLKIGTTDLLVRKVKKILAVMGDYESKDSSTFFSKEFEQAVKYFQNRHGIESDGVIGSQTIRALNVPVEERIKQVILNMERCRWLPILPEEDYLLVNIPAFSLRVMHEDSLVLACEAIVGKETNKTAIFKGTMQFIVFNPYWNVPDNILNKEVLPLISKNGNYLKDNHMEWHKGRLRQRPGPDNALGKIKFLFPNPFDIYLHDTPAKGLFKEQKRAFSHGCIRISAPYRLANYLLRDQKGWTTQKIDELLETSTEYYVKLDKGIPVYILYLTSFVDDHGKLNFREDLYNRDPSLQKMLMKN